MKTTFKTHEVCEMLGISKSTLFRWEADKLIPKPARTLTGVRRYSLSDIGVILDSPCAKNCKEFLKAYIKDMHAQADAFLELL